MQDILFFLWKEKLTYLMLTIDDIRRVLPELDGVYSEEEKRTLADLKSRLRVLLADMQRSESAAYQLDEGRMVLDTRIRALKDEGHERRMKLLAKAFVDTDSDELASVLRNVYIEDYKRNERE